jgi:hypothetical protein
MKRGEVIMSKWTWFNRVDDDLDDVRCEICGGLTHHGYYKDYSFICHPCCEELAVEIINEWSLPNDEIEETHKEVKQTTTNSFNWTCYYRG